MILKKYFAEVGNDVWIGYGAMLMPSIHIGEGTIIDARAVVTRNVRPYVIVSGAHVKIMRYRFELDEIIFL